MNINRKPRPNGNELKKGADARANIITHLELYERKDLMTEKDHTEEYGTVPAIVLRFVKEYNGSGRVVIADSCWFGSVKSIIALQNWDYMEYYNASENCA